MIEDLDIWRVAGQLMKRHGGDTALFAARRVHELLAEGDMVGSAIWKRILEAVAALSRAKLVKGRAGDTFQPEQQ
jgi:S-layer homology domain